jgi:hypothetical protein
MISLIRLMYDFSSYGGNSANLISGPDSMYTWSLSIMAAPHTIALSLESITRYHFDIFKYI